MKIEYVSGNIFDTEETYIVHGCNCFNTMGAGIAAQVFRYFKNAWLADTLTTRGDANKLGTYTYAVCENPFTKKPVTIINSYTQYGYSRDRVDVDYNALRRSFESICSDFKPIVLATVKIGCGLAGGDWKIVSKILEEVSEKYDVLIRVYTYEDTKGS